MKVGSLMKESQVTNIKVEKMKQTPQSIRLNSLKFYLSNELEEIIKTKQEKDLNNDEPMPISKKELNELYFKFIERIDRQKDFYFPIKVDKK